MGSSTVGSTTVGSHRERTARAADRVVTVQDGRVRVEAS